MDPVEALVASVRSYSPETQRNIVFDVKRATNFEPGLWPCIGVLRNEHGVSRELVQLRGTLPIQFQGQTYRIPMVVFLTEYHPRGPPVAQVTPTPRMRLKPGHRIVDERSGIVVNLEYLTNWDPYRCSLPGLLRLLRDFFGLEPPVEAYSPEQLHFDLVSKLERKVRDELEDIHNRTLAELNPMVQALGVPPEAELEQGKKIKLKENISAKSAELESMKQWLSDNSYLSEDVDASQIMQPVSTYDSQLLRCHAENDALQDGLALLHDAYEAGKINLPTFVSEVRRLSKDQFKARALIRKIQRECRGNPRDKS
mmetsp:Transcript_11716/g.23843  ORF Transcript_11716/g.23843 Transcript_11716/m.23843 type:complete len:312 (-) Transcript_11716:649-1584(-)